MGLSRETLWSVLDGETGGGGDDFFDLLVSAYENSEYDTWLHSLDSAPHGYEWATGFHASSAPRDDGSWCARKAVYELLDPPSSAPIEPKLRAMFDQGLDLEHHWVRRLREYGVLLSNDPGLGERQTYFEDSEHWLGGSSDAIVFRPGATRARCVEIKTTSHEKVIAMLRDPSATPWSHPKYLRQLGTYIALAHEEPFAPIVILCQQSGRLLSYCKHVHGGDCTPMPVQMQPPDDGTLIYSSREEPLTVASYRVTYDPAAMQWARARLAEARDAFLAGVIPEHPREGQRAKWSVSPCTYCDLKAAGCKADYGAGIKALDESNIIQYARSIRPEYDLEAKRAAVLARWNATDQRPKAKEGTAA